MSKKKLIGGMVAAAALIGGSLWFFLGGPNDGAGNHSPGSYNLAKIERRDVMKSVSATGTLSAVVTVEVGSQISGQISELLADYNSMVKKDQIIARINPDNYEAKLRQAEAELAVAQAKLLTQKADVERSQAALLNAQSDLKAAEAATDKAKAVLTNAERTLKRKKALIEKEYVSKTDYDTAATEHHEAEAAFRQAQAQQDAAQSQVAVAKASLVMSRTEVKEAEANVQLKEASLQNCRVDLDHTIIRSPVDGVVIDRSVDVGQTVAASLSAPVLFTIAQDLREMQVSTSVDEADIGAIREGQSAHFTVDAYGTRDFDGEVTQIRKASETVQNVVTYTVIISAANPDLALMPGMTADVRIVVAERRAVPAVPVAALRFQPQGAKASATSEATADEQPGGDPRARVQRLVKALELSEQQQETLKASLERLREKMKANSQNSRSLMPGPPRHEGNQVRKQFQAAIMAVLTPVQKQRFQLIINGRASGQIKSGTLWKLGANGQPESMRVALGVSDGSYTEVRGKAIELGLEVIAGTR